MPPTSLKDSSSLKGLCGDQGGMSALETAIVLISFVVVASVFAFSILNSGVLATEKSRETVLGGIQQASTALVLRGSVIGLSTSTPSSLESVSFQVTNAVRSDFSVDLSAAALQITYIDDDQTLNSASSNYTTTWLVGGPGNQLDPGDRVEFELDLRTLSPRLGANREFTIQVQPRRGGILTINRTTPAAITGVVNLN